MKQFIAIINDFEIVSQPATQLSWSHFIELFSIKDKVLLNRNEVTIYKNKLNDNEQRWFWFLELDYRKFNYTS